MVVRAVDHPRLDETLLSRYVVQHPGARFRDRRQHARDLDRLLTGAADQARDGVLQLVVSERFGLAEQQRHLRRKLAAALHDLLDGVDQVVHVQERLAVRGRPGVDPAGQVLLGDPLNLLRQRYRMREVVIDAGDAQEHGPDVAPLVMDELFGPHFRLGVGPRGLDRRIFRDELARLDRTVDEHRAREDELLDLKVLRAEFAQQPAGPLHCDLLVFGARLSEEIVIGGEMDHGSDVCSMVFTDGLESLPHALVGRDLDGDVHATRRRGRRRLAVDADHIGEAANEPPHHSVADPTTGARNEDDPAVRSHDLLPRLGDGMVAPLTLSRPGRNGAQRSASDSKSFTAATLKDMRAPGL